MGLLAALARWFNPGDQRDRCLECGRPDPEHESSDGWFCNPDCAHTWWVFQQGW